MSTSLPDRALPKNTCMAVQTGMRIIPRYEKGVRRGREREGLGCIGVVGGVE